MGPEKHNFPLMSFPRRRDLRQSLAAAEGPAFAGMTGSGIYSLLRSYLVNIPHTRGPKIARPTPIAAMAATSTAPAPTSLATLAIG